MGHLHDGKCTPHQEVARRLPITLDGAMLQLAKMNDPSTKVPLVAIDNDPRTRQNDLHSAYF